MLNRDQKIYLIKKVECFALSDRRIETMKEYVKVFPIAEEDVREISDFVMLREETIRAIMEA
jgi:hypothetical protein